MPAILFLPLLADVLLTLLWRLRHGRSIFVAHADHLYQIGISRGLSHVQVSAIYWAAMASCGVIGWVVAHDPTHAAPAIAFAVLASLAVAASVLVRRRWAVRARN